jgi:hypothetical protein
VFAFHLSSMPHSAMLNCLPPVVSNSALCSNYRPSFMFHSAVFIYCLSSMPHSAVCTYLPASMSHSALCNYRLSYMLHSSVFIFCPTPCPTPLCASPPLPTPPPNLHARL